jgi:cytochrome oxidase Cu insertion factor (SCO1/SenC/PrrC family)
MSDAGAKPERSLKTLWLLIAVCVAPIAASYIAFYFWQPSGQVNYGELLAPRLLPDAGLTAADGARFEWQQFRGSWVLVVADAGGCDEFCRQKLVYIRQIRLAQGKETDRIERVWLLTDGTSPDAALLAQHAGLRVVRAAGAEALAHLPATGAPSDHIYVIDPLGHLMMRYPRDADPRRIVKDVARLLRHSKWK